MSIPFDAIVVGAGIVGTACTLELAQAGMRVALVDPSGAGLGATAAGMGHIVVMDDSPAQFRLTHFSQLIWQQLVPTLPADCEYEQTGTLWLAADEEEKEEVLRKHALYAEHGVRTEVLGEMALRELEPGLRAGLAGALLVPGDGVVYAPNVARTLAERCIRHGATMIPYAASEIGGGNVRLANGENVKAPRIVNAAGEWAAMLTPGLPIARRKGHLAITDRYRGLVRHQLVELGYLKSAHKTTSDSVAFNVQPRSTGQVLIGSSRQYGVETAQIDHDILARMLERAMWYLPVIEELSVVRLWTGFRAATPDKLPLIGPWPQDETVYLATGHEGLGITTSLGTAKIIAAHICETQAEIPMEPYLPCRIGSESCHV